MVITKHCCHGECRTDSRCREYWPKSLVELEESGKKVFIPFPKPSEDIEKCRRWIVACLSEFFTEKNVSRNTYIRALHWPGEKGPTDEHPYPSKANLTPAQLSQAHAPKRKAPKSRSEPVTKKVSPVENDCGEESNDFRLIDDADQSLMEQLLLIVQLVLKKPIIARVMWFLKNTRTLQLEIWSWIKVRRQYFASIRFLQRWTQ